MVPLVVASFVLVNFSLTGDGARESQELMDQLADDMDELMRLMQEGDSSEDPNHFQISGPFNTQMGVEPKIGGFYHQKWMVKIMENPLLRWMIWGTIIFGNTHIWLYQYPNRKHDFPSNPSSDLFFPVNV